MVSEQANQWEIQGYVMAQGLFSPEEVTQIRQHFMDWNASDRKEDFDKIDATGQDPLAQYPRIIHPHRKDQLSLNFLLDDRIKTALLSFLPEAPYAAQTMFYFKPPGARGQALHQDQTYLRAHPGTCVAAWLAIDDCDNENGCMRIVPGSHTLPLLCPVPSDQSVSFTSETVPVPENLQEIPALMKAGDVLFFHGNLIHGSGPNQSPTRFRRALIAHYITADAKEAWSFYHPLLKFDGTEANLKDAKAGSECGQVTPNGIKMVTTTQKGPESPH